MDNPIITRGKAHCSEAAKAGCEYILSIQDYGDVPVETPEGIIRHKRFFFDDLDDPNEGRESHRFAGMMRLVPPSKTEVESMLNFYKEIPHDKLLLVHCFAGVSRSTATTLMLHAYRLGPGAEKEACKLMVQSALPGIYPNKLIVQYADELLGRNGQLKQAFEEWNAEYRTMLRELNSWLESKQEE